MAEDQGAFSVIDAALSFDTARDMELALLDGEGSNGACSDTRLGGMVWTMPQGLVVPKSFTNYQKFEAARDAMAQAGWPVHLRQTGGDLTPQGPGVINLSYVFTTEADAGLSIAAAYHRLCRPIIRYLKEAHNIQAYCSEVSGAFCDGKFNVVVDGIKIAGTAQKWRPYRNAQGNKMIAVLAHAALIGDADVNALISASNEFYKICDVDRVIDEDRQTSLASLLGGAPYDREAVMRGLSEALRRDAFEGASSFMIDGDE